LTVVAAPQAQITPASQPPAQAQPPQPVARERIADASQRLNSKNKMKQMVLGIINYHDSYLHFPQNVVDKNGKLLLSWRVQILPFIEQDGLYKEFRQDEPWDSEHNKKLLAKMPDLYRIGFEPKDETKTYYKVFAATGTPFNLGKKVSLIDVTDGASKTLGVVEAGPPVEWTKPADIPYELKREPIKLDLPFRNVFTVATLEGEAYSFRPNLDQDILRRLIECADGQVVPELNNLEAKFTLTREEIEASQGIVKQNEKLIEAIGEQLREQHKLLATLKDKKADVMAEGIDPNWPKQLHDELEKSLATLKRDTEELRKFVEAAGKK
jgi:hypothetical protein